MVEKAIDAGIPVIILDRNVNTDRITQFIGGDNVVIGQAAGEYAVKLLGGPGNAKGNVVEIWGGFASAPAHDRSTGFHAVTDKEPGIKYLLAPIDTEWKAAKGYEIMATALQANENIDLVYAHNDPLAYNAYLASKDAGREKGIKFMGIDGIPDEGVTWVEKGELDATFLYATPGRRRHSPGVEAPERREDREEDHPADDDDHQGQRGRDHQGQRLITGADAARAGVGLQGEKAPVDREDRARYEASGGRGQKQRGTGYLVGLAEPAQGRAAEQLRAPGRIVSDRLGQRGLDPAGRQSVHADTLRRIGDRQRLGELGHAALAGGVGWHQRAAQERHDRCEIDDGAASRRQQRPCCRAGAHSAGEIDVNHLREHGKVVLGGTVDDSGAVDQDIEGRQGGDYGNDGRLVADIERDCPVPACRGFRRRGAGNQHLAAERCESGGDAVADAAGAADHQDAPAGE